MNVNSEDITVAGIEENIRESEHFNEHFLGMERETSDQCICICPKNANHKNEYLMNV